MMKARIAARVVMFWAVALLVAPAVANDWAMWVGDWPTCSNAKPAEAIPACNLLIALGRLQGHDLAVTFNDRGNAHSRNGDDDQAIADYTEAIRLNPRDGVVISNRAWTYHRKHDLERALADFNEAIRLVPTLAERFNGRGLAYQVKGDLDHAIADYDQAIKLDPKEAKTFYNRAVAYKAKGDLKHAIADYDEAIRLDPKYAHAFVHRGHAYKDKGDLDHAIADYREAIQLDPRNAVAFSNRGFAFKKQGNLDHAIADYDEAILLDPNYAQAFVHRGHAYKDKGDLDRAISDFNEAIKLDPKNVHAFNGRAGANQDKGDLDHAIADYNEAIRINPKDAHAFNDRGFAFKQKGDFNAAIADLSEAIRIAPKLAVAFGNRGDAFRQLGEIQEAIADLSEAIRLDPNITTAYTNRGLAYEKSGDLVRARTDFNSALERPAGMFITGKAALQTARERLVAIDIAKPQASALTSPEIRLALVIGNSTYKAVSALPNPKNDAKAVADALKADGFTSVRVVTDATHDGLIQALRTFQDQADTVDWAVVYYAGHGIEIGGVNYLVPTDARLKADRDAQDEAVSLNRVLDAVAGAKKLKLVLLDACRENPFVRQMRRTIATRAVSRGLASIEPEGATLVVYAAKDGEVAEDGDGDHSPFTAALIKRLAQPGVEINKLFRLVASDVFQATGKRQRPFVYGSILGEEEFFFKAQ